MPWDTMPGLTMPEREPWPGISQFEDRIHLALWDQEMSK